MSPSPATDTSGAVMACGPKWPPSRKRALRAMTGVRTCDLKVPLTNVSLHRTGEPQRGDVVVFMSPQDGTRLNVNCWRARPTTSWRRPTS